MPSTPRRRSGDDRPAPPPLRVLLVEREAATATRLRSALERGATGRLEVTHVPRLTTAMALLGQPGFDAVLLDLDAPAREGRSPVERLREVSSIPLIGVTAGDDAERVLAALRAGACDCLRKGDADSALLVRSVLHAVEVQRLRAELDRVRQREHYLSTHDPLTGLPNRTLFEDQLRRACFHARRFDKQLALLFVGLDRFRTVNDTLGHTHGDALMALVAGRLRGALRKSDLVARVGGDEFLILLDDLPHPNAAGGVAGKLAKALGPAHEMEGREYWVSASMGIAVFPRDGDDAETLLRNSYIAMRQAKAVGGGNCRYFSQAMNDRSRRRALLEERLRRALAAGELELHYQPKVEIGTGRITGAEALLRWTDSRLGVVAPKDLIPLAEETGLIADIGAWSLRTACAEAAAWQRAGYPDLRISVNLSARQIVDDGLRESVVRALWDTGLAPESLELEITESSIMENEDVAIRLLEDLKRVGVTVSLDDFGTGFSSLSYLKRFPVDVLKIDQSFVRDIALDPDDAAIVGAIISIAGNLDLGVIAEGVETEPQRAFLAARGCPEMQGFLVAPALPSATFVEMLRRQSSRPNDAIH